MTAATLAPSLSTSFAKQRDRHSSPAIPRAAGSTFAGSQGHRGERKQPHRGQAQCAGRPHALRAVRQLQTNKYNPMAQGIPPHPLLLKTDNYMNGALLCKLINRPSPSTQGPSNLRREPASPILRHQTHGGTARRLVRQRTGWSKHNKCSSRCHASNKVSAANKHYSPSLGRYIEKHLPSRCGTSRWRPTATRRLHNFLAHVSASTVSETKRPSTCPSRPCPRAQSGRQVENPPTTTTCITSGPTIRTSTVSIEPGPSTPSRSGPTAGEVRSDEHLIGLLPRSTPSTPAYLKHDRGMEYLYYLAQVGLACRR